MHTLIALARRAAERWPDGHAMYFDATGETITFAEFDCRTDAIAAGLVDAGVRPGDRVAVCTANTPLFPLAWFAVMKARAIMVPLNIAYRLDDARHLLELAEPCAAICDAARVPLVRSLMDAIPSLRLAITDGVADGDGWRTLDSIAVDRPAPFAVEAQPDDLTNIQFTSGTSGLPKGCMLSHDYWVTLAQSVDEAVISLRPGETMLTAQALSYLDPQWALALTLRAGARLVILERFRPTDLWRAIAEHRATFFYCLAAMPLMLLSLPAQAQERSHQLRVIMCSAIPADRHRELEERFGVPWLEAYGATETGSDLGVRWSDHPRAVGVPTIGTPLPHREVMIADEAFEPVPHGEVGELLVRGGAMMSGYWRNVAATEAAFHDGWYRTGDLARQGENGFYFLVGRRKDMIRRAGENIAAAEVEATLQQHPAVMLAACISVPDPVRNEEIKAFVVLTKAVDIAELVAFLETRLARFKIPRYWDFVSELPMTPSERVAKPKLSREICEPVVDWQERQRASCVSADGSR